MGTFFEFFRKKRWFQNGEKLNKFSPGAKVHKIELLGLNTARFFANDPLLRDDVRRAKNAFSLLL